MKNLLYRITFQSILYPFKGIPEMSSTDELVVGAHLTHCVSNVNTAILLATRSLVGTRPVQSRDHATLLHQQKRRD